MAVNSEFVRLPNRPADAHKNTFGHVLVVAGSRTMPGAAALVGLAALRSGAGLVTVLTSRDAHPIVAGFSPCLMVVPAETDEDGLIAFGPEVKRYTEGKTAVALGPGLGRSKNLESVVRWLYAECPLPMVVDADGLNNLASAKVPLSQHAGERILTPHLGEFQRLLKASSAMPASPVAHSDVTIEEARRLAVPFAAENRVVAILKGQRSLITNGVTSNENTTGSSALATAGTGDVLTGLTVGLLAQGLTPLVAATTAAHLHGLAAQLASPDNRPIIATDVIEQIPSAMSQLA